MSCPSDSDAEMSEGKEEETKDAKKSAAEDGDEVEMDSDESDE